MKHTISKLALAIGLLACSGYALAAGTTTGSMQVQATIKSGCTMVTNPLNFGIINVGANGLPETDAQTTLVVTCGPGLQITIGLDNGSHYLTNTRRMEASGQYLPYALYKDSARTLAWTNASPVVVNSSFNNGQAETFNIYGRIPAIAIADPIPSDATYLDVVTVKVDFS